MDDTTPIPEIHRRLPGRLRGGACLALQTYQAAELVRGRPGEPGQPAILGLFAFASMLRTVQEGADERDPYARWWLDRIAQALSRAEDELARLRDSVREEGLSEDGLQIAECYSVRPAVFELRFAQREAYRAARLLAAYDRLVLEATALQHHDLLPGPVGKDTIRQGGRALRRAFLSPTGYRRTGVKYSDIRAGNELAQKAQELMGPLPEDWDAASVSISQGGERGSEGCPALTDSSVLTAVR